MRAGTLRNPSYQIQLGLNKNTEGNRTSTLIIDGEGRWCDIPCASDVATLHVLVEQYFKPRVAVEIERLKQLQMLGYSDVGQKKEIELGTGLFHYEPPASGMFEEEMWKGALVQAFVQAGLQVNPIPAHLFPSLHPVKDDFLDQEVDPLDYYPVSDLLTNTYVICPALSRFDPGHLSGDSLAIGYKSAIGIDGAALLELLSSDQIQTFRDHPEYNRVYVKTVKKALKKIL